MREAQLVLQDSLAIGQGLDLVGQGVESFRQSVCEVKMGHAHDQGMVDRRVS